MRRIPPIRCLLAQALNLAFGIGHRALKGQLFLGDCSALALDRIIILTELEDPANHQTRRRRNSTQSAIRPR
jgi:hypothetical protein